MFRLISILLMLSLSCQSLVKLGILTWYEINKQYVADKLCENKNKPQLNCNGKCYLKKQLKKADANSDSNKSTTSNERMDMLECILPESFCISLLFESSLVQSLVSYSNQYCFSYVALVFHPPSA